MNDYIAAKFGERIIGDGLDLRDKAFEGIRSDRRRGGGRGLGELTGAEMVVGRGLEDVGALFGGEWLGCASCE